MTATRTGRLVVFDCDGVLIDSEPLNVDLAMRAIRELGWDVTREEVVARYVGRSEADVQADVAAMTGAPVPQEWVSRWREALDAAYQSHLRAAPGVEAALTWLGNHRYAVCVASSATHQVLQRNLALTGLLGYFDEGTVFSATDVAHGKPAPDLFLHAAASLGFEPERCVVVEDSPFGVAAARAAGMPVVAYAGGVTTAAELTDADVLLSDLARLPEALSGGRLRRAAASRQRSGRPR